MSGKVKCSCGHSWNKSDSSKKDTYVCHICGKDNTMEDGGWLDKYQDGGYFDPLGLGVAKTDATRVKAPALKLTKAQLEKNKAINKQVMANTKKAEAKEIQARRDRIAIANAIKDKQFDSAENFAIANSASADKLRISEEPNFFDDYINPAVMFGEFGSGLGQIPLNIKQGDYEGAAMNFATPIVAGTGEAILEPIAAAALRPITEPLKYGMQKLGQSYSPMMGSLANNVDASALKVDRSKIFNELKNEALGRIPGIKKQITREVDKGNAWLKDWIEHPATQHKINKDFNKYYNDKGYVDVPTLRQQNAILGHKPNVQLYPLKNQFRDFIDLARGNKAGGGSYPGMIHEGNVGVSYTHQTPYFTKPWHERYGDWVSANPAYDSTKRTSTTIHEGTHGWVRKNILEDLGINDKVLDQLHPSYKQAFLQKQSLQSQGYNTDQIKQIMGEEMYNFGYLAKPTEVHARTMEIRKAHGLKPDDVIAPKDWSKIYAEKASRTGHIDPDHFKLFKDPQSAATVMNELWAVPPVIGAGVIGANMLGGQETPQQEMQRNGGWLDKYEDGGELKQYQPGGKVQMADTTAPKETKKSKKQESQLQTYYGPLQFENCQGAGCSKIATTEIANTFGLNYADLHPQDAWYRRASVLKNKGKEVWNPSMGNNYSGFKVGDLVSLDRSGNTYEKTASTAPGYTMSDNEGNEHVGEIVGRNKQGIPLIKHGSEHGKIYVQPINELFLPDAGPVTLNYKPQSVYRLAELENAEIKDKKFYMAPQKAIPIAMRHPNVTLTANEKKYINAINANAGKQQQMFGLSPEEAKMINTLGYGVFHNESNAGNTSWKRLVAPKMIGSELAHSFGRDASASLGDIQFKYDDAMYNADKSLSSVGKRMQNIGVTREGLSDWTHHRDDYNDEVNAVSALMSDYLDKFKNNPKYKYDPKKKTIFGDIPIDRALINIYHFGPTATKEKFLRNAKSYANNAMKYVDLLNYTGEAPKNIAVDKKNSWLTEAAKTPIKEDGGEVNYNDAYVSYPDNFVGQGYNTTGRNYSPAWGGQFQNGGELPQLQPGGKVLDNVTVKGKRQPIIVTNPRDPRLRAYNDSLAAYNASKNLPEAFSNNSKKITNAKTIDEAIKIYNERSNLTTHLKPFFKKGLLPSEKRNALRGKISEYMIHPHGAYKRGKFVPGPLTPDEVLVFKKPTQPVEYINRIRQTETPELQDLPIELPVDISLPELRRPAGPNRITMGKPLFKGGPQTDYYTPIDEAGNVVQSPEFKTRDYAMGGSIGGATQGIPGATGFMYSRDSGSTPSNGKYAKKTIASAQNGMEMKYYQEGLDFQPKTISRNGSVIKDDMGQWAHPGEITEIDSNQITMQGVPYPVLGISDTGDMQMMYPDEDYIFDGESVTEYPMAQDGRSVAYADNTRLGAVPRYPRPSYVQPQEFGLMQAADVATDIMQLGHFIPTPLTQGLAFAGDFFGAGIDGYQAMEEATKGNYGDAAINAATAILPGYLKSAGYLRSAANATPGSIAEKIAKLGLNAGNYRPLTALPRLANNPVIKKGINANKAIAGALSAETVYDAQGNKKKRQGGQLTKLDQLLNFTNYNTKQPGGWLDKYQD